MSFQIIRCLSTRGTMPFMGVAIAAASAALLVACAAPGDAGSAAGSAMQVPSNAMTAGMPPPPVTLADLVVGADWVAQRIEGVGALGTPLPRLRWTSASQVSGSGGCNQFAGKSVLTDAEVRLGPLAATRMACMPTPSGQEDKFFKALEATTKARLERGVLLLVDAQGNELMRLIRQAR